MFHVSIYANNDIPLFRVESSPRIRNVPHLDLCECVLNRSDQPLTSICTCTSIMDAQEGRELDLVVEESANGGIVLWKVQKKEKHGWRGGEY